MIMYTGRSIHLRVFRMKKPLSAGPFLFPVQAAVPIGPVLDLIQKPMSCLSIFKRRLYTFYGNPSRRRIKFSLLPLAKSRCCWTRGLPLLKPPYSTITAIDMNLGEILWQAPNGDGLPCENNPAVEGLDLPPLGGGGRHPVLVTSTLLIHGQNEGYGPILIARSKETGEELAKIELPGDPQSAP
ncbi:MAG: hypothetical protein Ct9H300mP22_5780 [Gammaproteobacteria bacterium]|nr:MAG: hypothetical protein Ct9H300mP22_5780 [Gammaproteobacteria bacterium]